MDHGTPIYVAGHRGLVGAAIVRALRGAGYENLILRRHRDLDLIDQRAVRDFFQTERPRVVVMAAARVGGILANRDHPAEFIYENLAMQTHVIHAAWQTGVERVLFLGSSCIYPRDCPQPMREEYLMGGPLEFTNRPYAVAKIAGIEMCWSYNRQYGTRYLALMPTNLYGPGDSYDPDQSHVLPAMVLKMHRAKQASSPRVTLWGTGRPRREFLYVDDLADACRHLLELSDTRFDGLLWPEGRANPEAMAPLVNIGYGTDVTIRELAEKVRAVVGFQGELEWDESKPDGTPRKLLDSARMLELGWKPRTDLARGIRLAYEEFLTRGAPGT